MSAPPDLPPPEIHPFGLDAVLVRFTLHWSEHANRAAQRLAADLSRAPLPGQTEAAPGLGSVLLRLNREVTSQAALIAALQTRLAAPPPAQAKETPRRWLVPACFGGEAGPDLAAAARLAGRSETALVAELCATDLRVLALGFAPGQPYLGPLPEHWQMPRLPALTPRVPAGTLATALAQLVLFTAASPTGWRALGRTALRPFAPLAAQPFALAPGDILRFSETSEAQIAALEALGDPLGGAVRDIPK